MTDTKRNLSPKELGQLKMVTFRLPVTLIETIKAVAKRDGITQAAVIRRAVDGA